MYIDYNILYSNVKIITPNTELKDIQLLIA